MMQVLSSPSGSPGGVFPVSTYLRIETVYVCVCVYIYVYSCMRVCVCIHIYIYIYVCVCVYTYYIQIHLCDWKANVQVVCMYVSDVCSNAVVGGASVFRETINFTYTNL